MNKVRRWKVYYKCKYCKEKGRHPVRWTNAKDNPNAPRRCGHTNCNSSRTVKIDDREVYR